MIDDKLPQTPNLLGQGEMVNEQMSAEDFEDVLDVLEFGPEYDVKKLEALKRFGEATHLKIPEVVLGLSMQSFAQVRAVSQTAMKVMQNRRATARQKVLAMDLAIKASRAQEGMLAQMLKTAKECGALKKPKPKNAAPTFNLNITQVQTDKTTAATVTEPDGTRLAGASNAPVIEAGQDGVP